ncbi:MAG: pyridoxal 5'-phosphate synthase lyase subunit PdxS [Thermoplasmatota archaeon]
MTRTLDIEKLRHGTTLVKRGFAKMQKGGVVMDVTTPEQARIAEDAGAVAVMALERVPADIRTEGGVARMSDPAIISAIIDEVTIPVMAKARIGHIVEARILESLGVDMIDESEVLTPADPFYHTFKRDYTVPFVCGARSLGEAVRRIWEGAAMIRTKGEAGTGNVVEAVRHRRMIAHAIDEVAAMDKAELETVSRAYATSYLTLAREVHHEQGGDMGNPQRNERAVGGVPHDEIARGLFDVLLEVHTAKRLPVVDFAAGGIATPADAALMMQLGNDGVFVGSGIFKSSEPAKRAKAIVEATTHFDDAKLLAEISKGLGDPMRGIAMEALKPEERLQGRGW